MNSKLILLDVDGVLLDWNTQFHSWMSQNGHPIKHSESSMIEDMYELEVKEVRKCIREFNETENIANLLPINGAVDALRNLKDEGYMFKCITSLSVKEEITGKRQKNLDQVFGNGTITETIFLNTYSPKKEILESFSGTHAWWIEDNFKNAVDGFDVGLRSIYFSNKESTDSRILFASSWKEILTIILG